MFFSKIKLFLRFYFVVLLTITTLARADELLVFSDEYVVELEEQSNFQQSTSNFRRNLASNEKAIFNRLGAEVKKNLSQQARLIKKNGINTRKLSRTEKFNPNDTYCEDLIASNIAVSCSPNYVIKIQATPNDPNFNQTWGLSNNQGINAISAWDLTQGSNQVVVAVIDSGIDYNHQDLKANMWVNENEIPNNGIDDDQNGYIDDVHGISAINSSGDPMDQNGHGTHVAGTIGAKGNNNLGVAGVNWNVKMMGLKFLDQNGSGSLSDAIEAINYMTMMKKRGVNIVVSNNSWGGIGFVQSLQNAIQASIQEGIIFVAAAGNSAADNDTTPSYPASYQIPGIISVAAIDSNQNLASFSNYGLNSVHVSAPGVNIFSTFPGNNYRSLSGTSMASPHVAGAIALLRSIDTTSNFSDVIQRLYETSVPQPALTGVTYTGRKINLERFVKNQRTAFYPPNNGSAECQYEVEKTNEQPVFDADQNPIVIQADEYNFHTINLPFDFPFYGENIRKLIVSPNGVVYTKNQPTSNDYLNTFTAPQNSIAALHTDLTAEVDPNGVRVFTSNNQATIYWRVKHYQGRLLGDLHIRLTVNSNGLIQSSLVTEDQVSLGFAQKGTVGIRGQNASDITTYAFDNSDLITGNMLVKYTPHCQSEQIQPPVPNSSVTSINAYSINKRGRGVKRVIPGKSLYFNFNGQGTGNFNLRVQLDGQTCAGNSQVNITNGVGQLVSETKRYLRKYKSVRFQVGTVAEKLSIKRTLANKQSLRTTTKSNKRFKKIIKKDCQRLLANII